MIRSVCAGVFVFASSASAQVIDFEMTHDGMLPTDGADLDRSAKFLVDGVGVSFGFDTNGDGVTDQNAKYERRGNNGANGFVSSNGTGSHDTEHPGSSHSLGEFFLRQRSAIGPVPGVFVISYDAPVEALGGEIWDIDGRDNGNFEQWRVRALDVAGVVLGTRTSPMGLNFDQPGSLDSRAWEFTFQDIGEIRRVEIEYIGDAADVGLAFDNYSATVIPSPGVLGVLAAAGGFASRRRR